MLGAVGAGAVLCETLAGGEKLAVGGGVGALWVTGGEKLGDGLGGGGGGGGAGLGVAAGGGG